MVIENAVLTPPEPGREPERNTVTLTPELMRPFRTRITTGPNGKPVVMVEFVMGAMAPVPGPVLVMPGGGPARTVNTPELERLRGELAAHVCRDVRRWADGYDAAVSKKPLDTSAPTV